MMWIVFFLGTHAPMMFRNRMISRWRWRWRRLGLAGGLHHLSRAVTFGGQMLLRTIAIGVHGVKVATVGSAQLDIRSVVHTRDSHMRVHQGIPKQIEVPDLNH
jgi:hypothetical protein